MEPRPDEVVDRARSPVESGIARLDDGLERAERVAARLIERLAPVLAPDDRSEPHERLVEAVPEADVPLSTDLHQAASRVETLARRLENAQERLGL